jgi:hypothetical protein
LGTKTSPLLCAWNLSNKITLKLPDGFDDMQLLGRDKDVAAMRSEEDLKFRLGIIGILEESSERDLIRILLERVH